MRRGMNGLALQVQETLGRDPFAGELIVAREAADRDQVLWHDGLGLSLYAKRLERGRFVWPSANGGSVAISRRAASPTCSTGSTGVTRFTHSGRNARDRPFRPRIFCERQTRVC